MRIEAALGLEGRVRALLDDAALLLCGTVKES